MSPDYGNFIALDTTVNLVQQIPQDGYIQVRIANGSTSISLCDADGVNSHNLMHLDSKVSNSDTLTCWTPLIKKGSYIVAKGVTGTWVVFHLHPATGGIGNV